MRRAVEGVVAALALVVLAPVLGLLALAVRLDSRGPALFRQSRVGRGGVPFDILKLRTMRADGVTDALVTTADDRRVTRVGRWLRRSKLDELPQLVNVVRGEMAFVGPRPEVADYVALWPADLRAEILSVRPGITDPATLAFREEEELLAAQDEPEQYYREVVLPLKVAMYCEYVRSRCVADDVRIAARTVRSVVSR
ncbi:sugar transferase [Mumia sp. DW29H23]|uniref:sugar transferase n=1 Tax=Mumia sp. DW29H23 TaxID=3421241 RepID=UPI003D68B3CF